MYIISYGSCHNLFLILMEQGEHRSVKALLCQVKGWKGDKKGVVDRIRVSLDEYGAKDGIDVVVFPEISFGAYNYANKE